MKTPALLLMLALILSGCAEDGADDTDAPADAPGADVSDAATNTTEPTSALEVTIDPVPGDAPETLDVSGTVTPGALVLVRVVDDETTEVEASVDGGAWSATINVPIGQSVLHVIADDGATTANASLDLIRLGEMTFHVTYKGSVMEPREDPVRVDPDDLTSADLYADCEVAHPGHFTVHDAMLQWALATDVEVTYGDCGSFGYSVEAIDGHQSPGFWCYTIDGEAAETGISSQAIAVGQAIAWDDCTIVLG